MSDPSQKPAVSQAPRFRAPKALALAAALTGLGVLASTAVPFATSVNAGLALSFNQIGKNLLGNAAFSAYPVDPVAPATSYRIDIAADTLIPTALGVFYPVDPVHPQCSAAVRLDVRQVLGDSGGFVPQVTLLYDATRVTPLQTTFPAEPIDVARCQNVAATPQNLVIAQQLNTGLAQALDSVGKNLFGSAVFSAYPVDPVTPANPFRIDFAADTAIPAELGVFYPVDPVHPQCERVAQIDVRSVLGDSGGFVPQITVRYDPSQVTAMPVSFATDRYNVARCNVPG